MCDLLDQSNGSVQVHGPEFLICDKKKIVSHGQIISFPNVIKCVIVDLVLKSVVDGEILFL